MGFLSRYWRRICRSQSQSASAKAFHEAEAGDAEAQFGLGLKFCIASGPGQDLEQGARWYRKAAEQGHTLAQLNLGVMCALGQGMAQDDAAALGWTRKAAEGGDASAQFNLGSRCHRTSVNRAGKNCGESRVEAYKWFSLASAQGYEGSAAACERITLDMTRDELTDGNLRAAAFVATIFVQPPRPLSTEAPK